MYQCHVSIHSNGIYIQSNRLVYHHSEYAQVSHTDKSPFSHSIKAVVLHVCWSPFLFDSETFNYPRESAASTSGHEWGFKNLISPGFFTIRRFLTPAAREPVAQRSARQWTAILLLADDMGNGKESQVCLHFSFAGYTLGFFYFFYFVCRHFSLSKIVWRNWNFGEKTCRSGITRGVGFTRYSRPTA